MSLTVCRPNSNCTELEFEAAMGNKNLRTALILASVAATFAIGFVARYWFMGH
jgi:hypothetical protein